MNINEVKCIDAKDIVNQTVKIEEIQGKYVVIHDRSLSEKFNNLNRAICLMAEKEWKCVNITFGANVYLYALMEKI